MDSKEIVHSFFENRSCVLATMHHKERVIAPLVEDGLGVKIIVPEGLNTDLFGTFTLDIARRGDQFEAARHKAREAMALSGATLGISSEGTFGPHPVVPFIPFNREIIMLIDQEKDMEITGIAGTTETNFGEKIIRDFDEAYQFALEKGFPQHGMIIKTLGPDNKPKRMVKGITKLEELKEAFQSVLKESNKEEIIIETDMRAMYNPTRMKNIEEATKDLISKIYSLCPSCSHPGFTLIDKKKGLPCSWCGLPTELILAEIYNCNKCGLTEEKLYPGGKDKAEPTYCNICNP